ncbi:MAG TPA: SdrD B-like domain-containing protein, partial [Pirellula sp.]|nr:SdrD B-like domain-containing protein [Pirellula sp.]
TANFLPLGNASGKIPVVNVSGQMLSRVDEDYFAFDLKKGDILDVQAVVPTTSTRPSISLINSQGTELLFSNTLFYPPAVGRPFVTKSPRFTTGVTLTYVIDSDSRYYLRVGDASNTYSVNLRTYRPTIEQESIGTKQKLFLDFDGSFIRSELLSVDAITALPATTLRVPAFSQFLSTIGLTSADAPNLIRDITQRVEQKLRFLLAANSNNGFYGQTGNPGDFDIEIVNSLDSPDIWGQPNVSRVLVGGIQTTFAIPVAQGVLGIAQSIDIGNFDREESVLVMLDTLGASALSATQIPRSGNTTVASVFAELVANAIAHVSGHTFGGMHQSSVNNVDTIMDELYDPLASAGAGIDGIVGTVDDKPLRFLNDEYSPTETVGGGVNNSPNILAFGLSTGKVGAIINGISYNDRNRNARQDSGDEGLAGWEVFADINNNGVRDLSEPRTVTGAGGAYSLQVATGTYNVRIVRPSNWIPSTSSEVVKTVALGGTANFGSVIPADTATGFKWLDVNSDGIRDANEPGLAGVYVYLDLDGDDRPDIGEPASITKADGSYSITPPGPGTYAIREVVEAGFVQIFPAAGEHIVAYDGTNPLRGFDFGNSESSDWGDAPAPYATTRAQNGASHGTALGLRLGVNFDADSDGRPSVNADGDDLAGLLNSSGNFVDDEDGATLLTPIVRGDGSNVIRVNVTNTAGSPAFIQGWIDFNGNGSWTDPGEQIATNV